MKNRNICKFNSDSGKSDLIAKCFIYETGNPTEGKERFLASDRLVLVITGEGYIISKKKKTFLKNGSLVFCFAGQSFATESIKDFSYMYIDFYGSRATYLYEKYGINSANCIFDNMSSLIPVWREAIVNADGENIDLLCESMILYSFSKLSKKCIHTDTAIETVLEYLNENFSSHTLSLATMAKDLGYNPKYLSHLISKELSVCFSDYLKDLRMKNAIILIEQGVTSVKNLSVLSGYSNPLYFSKAFKQSFGLSPRAFIENKQENAK